MSYYIGKVANENWLPLSLTSIRFIRDGNEFEVEIFGCDCVCFLSVFPLMICLSCFWLSSFCLRILSLILRCTGDSVASCFSAVLGGLVVVVVVVVVASLFSDSFPISLFRNCK